MNAQAARDADAPPSDAPSSDAPSSDAPPSDAPPSDAPPSDAPSGDAKSGDRPLTYAAVIPVPEVVVTPNRVVTPASQVGSAVSVVTAEDLEARQQPDVFDVLRSVPGVSVTRSGGIGKSSLIRIRGADEGATLVLIDGIKMNDPADARGAFDFDSLLANGIDRIEILRGPQSALYGSEAMGGVINILTERGKGPPALSALAEYGTYNTFRQRASVSGSEGPASYAFNVAHFRTDGISAVAPPTGKERDGTKDVSLNGRFGFTVTDNFDVDVTGGWTRLDSDFDPSSTQDGPAFQHKSVHYAKVEPKLELFGGRWENIVRVYETETDRDFNQPLSSPPLSNFDGMRYGLAYQSNVKVDHDDVFTFGLEREVEKATSARSDGVTVTQTSDNSTTTDSLFAQYLLGLFDSLYLTAGARRDDNDTFGANTAERFSAAYVIEATNTTVRASFGTAVKAPTLSQLFDPSFGNPALAPEESSGWDAGIEQRLFGDRITAGATFFRNDFTNLIQFAFPDGFSNVGKASAEGVETFVAFRPDPDWQVQANYTYTVPKNLVTGMELRRRPRNAVNASILYSFVRGGQIGLLFRYYGSRFDNDSNTIVDAPYKVFDLVASYDIKDYLTVFGRIENIADARYQELANFSTPGRSAYVGAAIRF